MHFRRFVVASDHSKGLRFFFNVFESDGVLSKSLRT